MAPRRRPMKGVPMTGGTESQSRSRQHRPTSRTDVAMSGVLRWGATAADGVRRRLQRGGPERGDVPGWVLVTLMTAGLVIAIWAIAGPALSNVFETAINRVLNF